MRFDSKIDWWFHIICILMVGLMIWLFIWSFIEKNLILGICGIIFLIINAAFIIPIWINTHYTFTDKFLIVKCGLSKPLGIPYKSIISIQKTKSPLASMALSLDRLEIKFRKGRIADIVYISPINQDEFLRQLDSRR